MLAFVAQHMCPFIPPIPHGEHPGRQVLFQVLPDHILYRTESCIQLPKAFCLIHGSRHRQVNMAVYQGRQNSCFFQIQRFDIRVIRHFTGMGRPIFPDSVNTTVGNP
jgi:hypothetical protein